jgi:hypothetical protein
METEQDRLQRLYGEMGDDHLVDLAEGMDDLRDEARMVLLAELRHRGLMPELATDGAVGPRVEAERQTGFGPGIPGYLPGGNNAMEQALEVGGEPKDGLSRLVSLYDGMELSKACAALDEAEMEPVIESILGDVGPARYEIWLATDQIPQAQELLRRTMGLFPLAEVDTGNEEDQDGVPEGELDGVVGTFETEPEAQEANAILAAAGINGTVLRQVDVETDEVFWQLSVTAAEHDKALLVVARGMGLE